MRILTAADVRAALPMAQAIEATKAAFTALGQDRAELPLRARLLIPPHDAVTLFMPVYVRPDASEEEPSFEALAVKIVSVFPHNPARNLSLIQAAVLVMDPSTGRPVALLEGNSLTALRTGAGSGAATDLLARPDSRIVAVFGAGAQSRTQLEAVCTVRPIEEAWIYDASPEKSRSFIDELRGQAIFPAVMRQATSPAEALIEADIVCAATTSSTPVFEDALLRPGTHINGVGSYTPDMQEIPAATVARALVVVDARSAALVEAGDLIQPQRQGLLEAGHFNVELADLLLGRHPGRSSDSQITFYKSVGIAIQDAYAAHWALTRALELNLGQEVDW